MNALIDIERIRAALAFIPSTDRETWVQIGMAVKSELGDDGFNLWDGWSRSASSYNEKDAKSVWRSFHSSGITIATLFKRATEHGYRESEPVTPVSTDACEHRQPPDVLTVNAAGPDYGQVSPTPMLGCPDYV